MPCYVCYILPTGSPIFIHCECLQAAHRSADGEAEIELADAAARFDTRRLLVYSAGRFEMQISFGAGDVASVGSGRVRLVALSAPADKRAVPYAELAARLGF